MERSNVIHPIVPNTAPASNLRKQAANATDAQLRAPDITKGFFGPGVWLFARAGFLSKAMLMGVVLVIPLLALIVWQLTARYNDAWDARMVATAHHVELVQGMLAHFHAQEVANTLTREEAQELAKNTVNKLRYNTTNYFWIHNVSSRMVTHPMNPALNGQDLSQMRDANGRAFFQEMIQVGGQENGGFVRYLWQNPGESEPTEKISYVRLFKPWGWVVGSGVYMEDVIIAARQQLIFNGSVILTALLLTSYLFVAFYRLMTRCLNDLQNNIRAIRDGDLTTTITYYGKDEIANALHNLADMQSSLRNIVSAVRTSSADIAHSVREVGHAANDLASRTEHTASNLTESASAMEEIQSTAAHTAANTEEGSRLARDNAEAATHSMQVMQEMVRTMQTISQTSDKIQDIVSTMDSIAFQTNILALNAAVEAARSGEAGRGFAVVAGEVRALAQRSSQASGEISDLIAESVKQVETGRNIVLKSENAIKDVLTSSERVNQLLKEISTGAQEQTVGISEVSQALAELDSMTQQNAAMVEETAATAAAMGDLAERLSGEVSRFRLPNHGY